MMKLETVRAEAQKCANGFGIDYLIVHTASAGYQFMDRSKFNAMDEETKARHEIVEEITPQKTEV